MEEGLEKAKLCILSLDFPREQIYRLGNEKGKNQLLLKKEKGGVALQKRGQTCLQREQYRDSKVQGSSPRILSVGRAF